MSKNTTDLREQIRKIKNDARINYSYDGVISDEYEEAWTSGVLALISNREKLARIDEGELLTSRMQKAADTVPPNLLLNEMVNIQWARKDELESTLRKELDGGQR